MRKIQDATKLSQRWTDNTLKKISFNQFVCSLNANVFRVSLFYTGNWNVEMQQRFHIARKKIYRIEIQSIRKTKQWKFW